MPEPPAVDPAFSGACRALTRAVLDPAATVLDRDFVACVVIAHMALCVRRAVEPAVPLISPPPRIMELYVEWCGPHARRTESHGGKTHVTAPPMPDLRNDDLVDICLALARREVRVMTSGATHAGAPETIEMAIPADAKERVHLRGLLAAHMMIMAGLVVGWIEADACTPRRPALKDLVDAYGQLLAVARDLSADMRDHQLPILFHALLAPKIGRVSAASLAHLVQSGRGKPLPAESAGNDYYASRFALGLTLDHMHECAASGMLTDCRDLPGAWPAPAVGVMYAIVAGYMHAAGGGESAEEELALYIKMCDAVRILAEHCAERLRADPALRGRLLYIGVIVMAVMEDGMLEALPVKVEGMTLEAQQAEERMMVALIELGQGLACTGRA